MKRAMVQLILKLFCGGLLPVLVAGGCVTKSQADAQARAAYQAGQRDALATVAGQGQMVVITGPVKYPNVPWVEGLTVAQAIATADYTGRHNPKAITITRQGVAISVNPRDLLVGRVIPLQPGDAITIRE